MIELLVTTKPSLKWPLKLRELPMTFIPFQKPHQAKETPKQKSNLPKQCVTTEKQAKHPPHLKIKLMQSTPLLTNSTKACCQSSLWHTDIQMPHSYSAMPKIKS